jgi:flagellar biosynthesis protein FlhG
MITQADNLKNLVGEKHQLKKGHTKFISITSGKGGVGKSTITANLGYMLHELGFKIALFDADIGLANLDVILKVSSKKNMLHVLKGEVEFKDIIVTIDDGFYLIPGDSGDEVLKYDSDRVFDSFAEGIEVLNDLDFLIIDTGAGIGKDVQKFLDASDDVIVITTPEPAAITDAYAMVKLLSEKRERAFMILNQVATEKEATNMFKKISDIAKANMNKDFRLQMISHVKKDPIVTKGNIQRFLFTEKFPTSAPAEQIKLIAKKIAQILERKVLNEEETGLGRFFKKILNKF